MIREYEYEYTRTHYPRVGSLVLIEGGQGKLRDKDVTTSLWTNRAKWLNE